MLKQFILVVSLFLCTLVSRSQDNRLLALFGSDYATLNLVNDFDENRFTVETTFIPRFNSSQSYNLLAAERGFTLSTSGFEIYTNRNTNEIHRASITTGNINLVANQTYHFAGVYRNLTPTEGLIEFYINGCLVGSATTNGEPVQIDNTQIITIGDNSKGFNPSEEYNIDQSRFWRTALSESGFRTNFNSIGGGHPIPPDFLFNFQNEDGGDALMEGGNQHVATYIGVNGVPAQPTIRFSSFTNFEDINFNKNLLYAGPDLFICPGDPLVADIVDVPFASYAWRGPRNFTSSDRFINVPNLNDSDTGAYSLEVTLFGCVSRPDTIQVSRAVLTPPNLGPDTVLCVPNDDYPLDPGVYKTYLWNTGQTTPIIQAADTGYYQVEVVDFNGCVMRDDVYISKYCQSQLYVPNAFSPDYDDYNQIFRAYGDNVTNFSMRIFDRWGRQLFFSDNQLIGWDGTYKEFSVKDDFYIWVIKYSYEEANGFANSFEETGVVHLLR